MSKTSKIIIGIGLGLIIIVAIVYILLNQGIISLESEAATNNCGSGVNYGDTRCKDAKTKQICTNVQTDKGWLLTAIYWVFNNGVIPKNFDYDWVDVPCAYGQHCDNRVGECVGEAYPTPTPTP